MTTIKLKNGSGAPAGGDLVQGEPALDLTNKRLYTENGSGTVIEVGTNPTSITTGDITATGTASFANLATTGNITFGDDDKAIFGAGSDVSIYSDGTNGLITSTANFTLDVAGDITLDADGADIKLLNGGTHWGSLYTNSTPNNLYLQNMVSDGDIYLSGSDGGSNINALILDMSAAGAATFNAGASFGGKLSISGATATNELVHATFTNTSGAKTFAIGAGQSGVTNNGFVIRNVTDNTFPLVISDAGVTSFGAGNVGIGTNSPEFPITAYGSSNQVYIGSVTPSVKTVLASDETNLRAYIGTRTNHPISFVTDGDERMRISGGNLLVGTTSSTAGITATSGNSFVYRPAAELTVARQGSGTTSPVAIFNQTGDDGQILDLRKDGATVGSIGVAGSRPYLANNVNFGIKLDDFGGGQLQPATTAGAVQDAACSLGGSSVRWKDLYLSGTANVGSEVVLADSGTAKFAIGNSSNDFYIYSNAAGSERMRIDSSGNVGILNSSPSSQFFNNLVVGNNDSGDKGITIRSNAANRGVLAFSDTDSATDGRYTGFISYDHSDNAMKFHTNGGSERLRIDYSGNLLVGTTAVDPAGNNTAGMSVGTGGGLSVQGTNTALVIGVPSAQTYGMAFRFQGALAGRIGIEANNITVADVSDYRLKENVAPLSDALTKIKALKPSSYNFINDPDKTHEGFIAHELQEVIPYAVSGEKDALITEATKDRGTVGEIDPQAVDLRKLVPTLVKAIQEQNELINDLRARVAQLEGEA